jgi:hypothetical protein
MELEEIINSLDRAAAFIDLTRLYLNGTDELRQLISDRWDFGVTWDLPDQTRLACSKGERWSCRERIEASLTYSAIAVNQIINEREEIIALAVIYQSCLAAFVNPRNIFLTVAKVSTSHVRARLLEFLDRDENDKSLKAFFLSATKNIDGEIEIKPSWLIDGVRDNALGGLPK